MINFSMFLHFFTHFQERKNTRKIKRFSDLPTLPRLRHVCGNKAIFIIRLTAFWSCNMTSINVKLNVVKFGWVFKFRSVFGVRPNVYLLIVSIKSTFGIELPVYREWSPIGKIVATFSEWPPTGKIAAHSAYDMCSWYKCLIVNLVFSHLGFWSGNLFLIAPFPDFCLIVLFCIQTFLKNHRVIRA